MANPMPPFLPPGFRFHPTDEELILHYLRNHAAAASPCPVSIITEVDIYKFDPWDLPRKAMFGDQEWYFFSPRDRKYPNGVRPNRAAASGYWKATGTDKSIAAGGGKKCIGVKKALAFYQGKPPKGLKTNWMMHEYRLSESTAKNHRNVDKPLKLKDSSMRLDEWVLCRIYEKSNQVQEDSTLPCLEEELPHENKLNLPKSASLTELFKEADFSVLSRLLEVPVEAPAPEQNPFGYADWNQTFDNPNPMSGIDQYSSVSDAPNGVKHQRWVVEEEGNNNNSWAYNQFDSQAFFNQQLLLQSHLGMQ